MGTRSFGLVLGGGGTVGLAYHAGVLRALEEVAGVVPNDASLIVGTSAGAVMGAYLRTGWTTEDFWQLALGTHSSLDGLTDDEVAARSRRIMEPAWRDPVTLVRRSIGSAYVAGRSFVRPMPPFVRLPSAVPLSSLRLPFAPPGPVRLPSVHLPFVRVPSLRVPSLRMPWMPVLPSVPVPAVLGRLFPGGLFTMTEGRRRFAEELPSEWPERPLWLCAYDIDRGRRVVLGRPGRAPLATLPEAVTASCAIPGIYDPVRVGRLTLVDGGAWSTSNLDLASKAGCELIVGIVPMAFDTARPLPAALTQLVRRVPARMVVGEMADARRRGAEVLLLRPSARELRLHGTNLMRGSGWDAIARAAYEATARTLETDRFRSVLASAAAA